eukprot:1276491-Rhodomonas_salina.1
MEVLEGEGDAGRVEAGGVVGEAVCLAEMREELATDRVLEHEVQVVFVLERRVPGQGWRGGA